MLPLDATTPVLRLLHLADSAIPLGATAHSFGLEALADDEALTPENVEPFLPAYLEEAGDLEAAFLRRAFHSSDEFKRHGSLSD